MNSVYKQQISLTSVSGSPLTRQHLWKLTGRTLLENSLEASCRQATSLVSDCRLSQLTEASPRVQLTVESTNSESASLLTVDWLSIESTDRSELASQLRLNISEVNWLSTDYQRVQLTVDELTKDLADESLNWTNSFQRRIIQWRKTSTESNCRLVSQRILDHLL